MGLDMYLTRKTYVKNWGTGEAEYKISVTKNGKECHVNPAKISYIEEEAGYWRKANHIHKWFVDNIQEGKDDCGSYYVSRDDLAKLAETCQKVLDNPKLGESLLPTQNGFFFGNTSYDDYYLMDVAQTLDICKEALSVGSEGDFSYYYQSSW